MAYWLITGPRSAQRPEIQAFCEWLQAQGKATRETIGEVPDPDTVDDSRLRLRRVSRPIGQTTPLSLRMASSGTSCGSGSKSSQEAAA